MINYLKESKPSIFGINGVKHYYSSIPTVTFPDFETHWHDCMEFIYLKSGSLTIDFVSNKFVAGSGQLVIIPPGQLHGGKPGKLGAGFHTIQFNIDNFYNNTFASEKYLKSLQDRKISLCHLTDSPSVINSIKSLIDTQENHLQNPLITFAKVYELLGNIFDNCTINQNPLPTSNRFSKVFDYIEDHLSENISTKSISQLFNYNEAYFCRQFKEVTGLTTTNYINTLRIEKACKLLLETTLDIGYISEICGFSDFSYFCLCFRKHLSISPTQYRNKAK